MRWLVLFLLSCGSLHAADWEKWEPIVQSIPVQPMTGIVFWDDSPHVSSPGIQMEFFYLRYADVIQGPGTYDWDSVEKRLARISERGHQAILRFWDTYPGKTSGVPEFVRKQDDWRGFQNEFEGKPTDYPDWSNPLWQKTHLAFFKAFAEKYDKDPRIAFFQCGFGFWAEYHLYEGPFEAGRTFPDSEYQESFLRMMDASFKETRWMISIDSATPRYGPFQDDPNLKQLGFGLFDDSFLQKNHADWNAKNWKFFGQQRWQNQPAGGELSYGSQHDQKHALAKMGPHGESLEAAAARFHISYMIGNDQPEYASIERISNAGSSMGYRFQIHDAQKSEKKRRVRLSNHGVAPIYYDAFLALGGDRSTQTLKGLLPGDDLVIEFTNADEDERLTIESDRLVPGQVIGVEMAH